MRDDPGHFVAFGSFEDDGVLIPEDFDSFAMASAYFNIEGSLLFYEGLGMPDDLLVRMETYYSPRFEIVEETGESEIMEDNAFYMYVSTEDRGFYVFPYADFQWLPMSMNGGIMTHEFTHAVFDALVQVPNLSITVGAMSPSAANQLYGLNEGCADFMAVARMEDPDYMEHSIEKNVFGAQCNSGIYKEIVRDASTPIVYSGTMDNAARNLAPEAFCPYDIGAFFASTLYSVACELDGVNQEEGEIPSGDSLRAVATALYLALGDLGAGLGPDFELWDVFGMLAARLDQVDSADELCGVLQERYAMYYSEVPGC
jgi:hypothetical protein